MRINRFVLDANIWVSYFITGTENLLLKIKAENKLTLIYCDELLTEINRVIQYDHLKHYGISPREATGFIKEIGVQASLTYPIKNYIPGDTNDNYVVALALQTNAGFIASGDRHILSQKVILEKKYRKLHIISKSEFEKMF